MPEQNRPEAVSPSPPASRRRFLQQALQLGTAGLAGPLLFAACGDGGEGGGEETAELSCEPEGLAPAAQEMRENVQYVDQTPNPGERCDNCLHWQPDMVEGGCGGCAVLQGQVHPEGWCSLWVAQAA